MHAWPIPDPRSLLRNSVRRTLFAVVGLCVVAELARVSFGASREYAVDAEESQVRLRVMRQGALSVLAHDHILVAKGLAGRIEYNAQALASSSGQLSIPVGFIEVDDPKERQQEGFVAELNESNRASVRENMLSAEQLNVTEFPRITVAVDRIEGSLPNVRLHARIRIRDREQTLVVPATVSGSEDTLVVSGETDLLQSAFGITPYSNLFGAIAVQDTVRIKFQIVAKAG